MFLMQLSTVVNCALLQGDLYDALMDRDEAWEPVPLQVAIAVNWCPRVTDCFPGAEKKQILLRGWRDLHRLRYPVHELL